MIAREKSLKVIEKALEGATISPYFGGNYDDDEYAAMDSLELDVYSNLLNDRFEFFNGISKCVIVLEDSDFVVKIPFNGAYQTIWNKDEEEVVDFLHFTEANDINHPDATGWDYCENELIKYEKAQEEGFGKFFAHTEFYRNVSGHPTYLQEKVVPYSYNDGGPILPSQQAMKRYENSDVVPRGRTPADWAALLFDFYDAEEVNAFWEYADDNGLTNDLHSENIGFAQDGRPILLDWADWREDIY